MQNSIETERLILRPFEASDADAAFKWFGDRAVMRFTPTGPDKSVEQTEARLRLFMEHQKAHGFSKWLILDRASEIAIGDSGLLSLGQHFGLPTRRQKTKRAWEGQHEIIGTALATWLSKTGQFDNYLASWKPDLKSS